MNTVTSLPASWREAAAQHTTSANNKEWAEWVRNDHSAKAGQLRMCARELESALASPEQPGGAGEGEVEYEFEVWQDDSMQAGGSTTDYATAKGEADHYALMYGQDGPVEVRMYEKRRITTPPPAPAAERGDATCDCPRDHRGQHIYVCPEHPLAFGLHDPAAAFNQDQPEARGVEGIASSACPICGLDSPHTHTARAVTNWIATQAQRFRNIIGITVGAIERFDLYRDTETGFDCSRMVSSPSGMYVEYADHLEQLLAATPNPVRAEQPVMLTDDMNDIVLRGLENGDLDIPAEQPEGKGASGNWIRGLDANGMPIAPAPAAPVERSDKQQHMNAVKVLWSLGWRWNGEWVAPAAPSAAVGVDAVREAMKSLRRRLRNLSHQYDLTSPVGAGIDVAIRELDAITPSTALAGKEGAA